MISEEAREARRRYKKEWARKNPEKVKAQQERYWQRKAEREAAQDEQQAEGQCGGD